MESIALALSDGEIDNYIGQFDNPPSPLIKLALDNVIYSSHFADVEDPDNNEYMGVPV